MRKVEDQKINSLAVWILGFLTLIIPAYSSDAYLSLVLVFILYISIRNRYSIEWLGPYIFFLAAAMLVRWLTIDFHTALQTSLIEYIPTSKRDLIEILVVVCLSFLVTIFASEEKLRRDFLNGLVVASPILAITSIMQWQSEFFSILFPNQNSFWTHINRYSATVTDPNSLGIISLLLIVLAISNYIKSLNRFYLLIIATGIVSGLLSGSRSFLLGLFLTGVIFAFYYSKRMFLYVLLVSALCVLGINLIPYESLHYVHNLPTGVTRCILSLRINSFASMLSSRELFFNAGWYLWTESPLLGVGFNKFENYYYILNELLGNNDVGWVDNSNNFYLGVLAETGIIGALFLGLGVTALKPRDMSSSSDLVLKSGVFGFLLLLFTGPHLDFVEVTAVFALLVASSYQPIGRDGLQSVLKLESKKDAQERVPTMIYVALIIALSIQSFTLERGVYDNESGFRWFQPKAVVIMQCKGETIDLKFRAPLASYAQSPLRLTIESPLGQQESIIVRNSDIVSVTFKCPLKQRKELGTSMAFKLACSRYWVPADLNLGQDTRVLCAQIKS